jgi:hypothetical protein
VRFAFVRTDQAQDEVTILCRVLHVSRRGYYAWVKRQAGPPSARALANATRATAIQTRFTPSRGAVRRPARAGRADPQRPAVSPQPRGPPDAPGRPPGAAAAGVPGAHDQLPARRRGGAPYAQSPVLGGRPQRDMGRRHPVYPHAGGLAGPGGAAGSLLPQGGGRGDGPADGAGPGGERVDEGDDAAPATGGAAAAYGPRQPGRGARGPAAAGGRTRGPGA